MHSTARNTMVIVLIFFSFVGLVDASYLTAEHFRGGAVVCEIGGHILGDCETVTSSQYATVGNIPVALGGVLYYFAVFVLSSFLLTNNSRYIFLAAVGLTGMGFLGTLWFVYLQLFVLNAICIYCMVSALATTVLFITSTIALRNVR